MMGRGSFTNECSLNLQSSNQRSPMTKRHEKGRKQIEKLATMNSSLKKKLYQTCQGNLMTGVVEIGNR